MKSKFERAVAAALAAFDPRTKLKAIERANSHMRYWRYRRQIGTPIPLRIALSQWWRRLAYELLGIGNGA